MAAIENKISQIPLIGADGVDSQPVKSGRWIKISLGITLLCGLGLAFSIMAQPASEPTEPMTGAAESTNLAGLSPNLRMSSAAGSMCAGSVCIPVTSPYQKYAVAAMKAQNEGKSMRDVAMMAQADPRTKGAMDRLENAVVRAVAGTTADKAAAKEWISAWKTNTLPTPKPPKVIKAQEMAGITAPLGFWDPLGLSADISGGQLLWFREAELKHGRVSMLATLGILVGEKYHPFFGVGDIPSTMVFEKSSLNFFWAQLFILAFFLEAPALQAWKGINEMDTEFVPGNLFDLGNDPLLTPLAPKKEADLKNWQNKEINNGRLAMVAFMGMITQEFLTGSQMQDNLFGPR